MLANHTAIIGFFFIRNFARRLFLDARWKIRFKKSRAGCLEIDSWSSNRAFWITILIVSSSGILLDVFFGLNFFKFPNQVAVLRKYFYGSSFTEGWKRTIPIEAIGFYVFGIMAVLLVHVWGDEYWFRAYNVDDGPRRSARLRDVFSFHSASAW